MTSTGINVGIGDIKRNTSKVLKPPGGGSSDIFGSPEPPASHSLRKTRTFDQQTSGTVMNGTKSPTDSTPSSTTSSTGNHSHLDLTPPHHQQQSEPNPPQVNGGSADYDHESESSPLPEDAVEAEIDEKYSSSSLDETASNGSLEQSLSECKIESNNQTTVTTHSSSESVSSSVSSSSSSVRTKSASHSRIFGDDSDEWKQKKKVHVNGNHLNGGAQNGGAVDGTDGNPVTGDGYEPAPVKDARSNSTTSTGTADFKPRTRVPPGGFSSGLW